MALINVSQNDTIEQWRVKTNDISNRIGDPATLTTTNKSNVVGALSEVDTEVGNLAILTTSDKTSVVNAINSVKDELDIVAATDAIPIDVIIAIG